MPHAERQSSHTVRRRKLWDGGHRFCCYCECRMTRPTTNRKAGPMSATLEHKQPLSRGGMDSKNNTALACRDCNELKGPLTYDEFARAVRLMRDLGLTIARLSNGHVRWIGALPGIGEALGFRHGYRARAEAEPPLVPAVAIA